MLLLTLFSAKKASAQSPAAGNALLKSFIFIKAIRAMATTAFAAVTALEVVLLGETFVTFGRVVEIFALDGFIFVILFVHVANLGI